MWDGRRGSGRVVPSRAVRGLRLERALLVASALALACAAAPAPAFAQAAPGPSAADRDAAAKKFADGERAFKAGRFAEAGDAFEEANRLAPHPAPLWNAARARERAGSSARAANLYARYLREAPAEAPNRKDATASLAALEAKLARVDVEDAGATEIAVDGAAADARIVYVDPGAHTVGGKVGGRLVERKVLADAGRVTSVTLADPLPAPAGPAAPAPAGPAPVGAPAPVPAATAPAAAAPIGFTPRPDGPQAPARAAARRGASPLWLVIPAGGVLGFGSLSIGAFINGKNLRKQADAVSEKPSDAYDDLATRAEANEKLVPWAIGSTAIALAATVVVAVWVVDWKGSAPKAKVAATPGGMVLAGSF